MGRPVPQQALDDDDGSILGSIIGLEIDELSQDEAPAEYGRDSVRASLAGRFQSGMYPKSIEAGMLDQITAYLVDTVGVKSEADLEAAIAGLYNASRSRKGPARPLLAGLYEEVTLARPVRR